MSQSKPEGQQDPVEKPLPEEDAPIIKYRMEDLPPEVLTTILEFATLTLDGNRNNVLGFRRVSSQWKDIIDPLIEKRILSGGFPIFPGVKMWGDVPQKLHVRFPTPERLPGGTNSFPFNSLLLDGRESAADFSYFPQHPRVQMRLPDFISTFGGNLTSFALHDQIIPIDTLVAVLGSMPNLKLISIKNVKQGHTVIRPDTVFPTAPPLLSLTTLEIKNIRIIADDILCVWLIASYAHQLTRLLAQTEDLFFPLRKAFEYSHPLRIGRLKIASTTESAFEKLKQLEVSTPSKQFLELSETPGLQNLSIIGNHRKPHFSLEDLAQFLDKCGNNLESLVLDNVWGSTNGSPPIPFHYNNEGILLPILSGGVVVPKLKTLTFPYPSSDDLEKVFSQEFVIMFPSLEVLQLLRYEPSNYDRIPYDDEDYDDTEEEDDANVVAEEEEVVEVAKKEDDKDGTGDDDDDTFALKKRLPPIWHKMFAINTSICRKIVRRTCTRAWKVNQWAALLALRKQRGSILKRLDVLGERKEKVIVEHLLERGGFWNACANLKVVSVSSGEEPDGNICLLRREDYA